MFLNPDQIEELKNVFFAQGLNCNEFNFNNDELGFSYYKITDSLSYRFQICKTIQGALFGDIYCEPYTYMPHIYMSYDNFEDCLNYYHFPKSKFTLSGSSQPPSVVGVMMRSPLSPLPQESMSGLSMESWEAPSVPRAPSSWDVGCSEGSGRVLPHEENMRPKHKKAAIDATRTNSRKVFVFMINSILHFFVQNPIKWLII